MSNQMSEQRFKVWIGGIDDDYDSLDEALDAMSGWQDKGYDDVLLEYYGYTLKLEESE